MVRRFLAVLGALAVSLVGFIGVAGSAHAYTSENGVCETYEICMWQHSWMNGGQFESGNTTANLNTKVYRVRCTADCTLNDTVSSAKNNDTKTVRFFEHANYGGLYFNLARSNSGHTDEAMDLTINRASDGRNWNDRFSSFCFVYASNPASTRCRQG